MVRARFALLEEKKGDKTFPLFVRKHNVHSNQTLGLSRVERRTKTAHAVTRVTAGRDSRRSHFRT